MSFFQRKGGKRGRRSFRRPSFRRRSRRFNPGATARRIVLEGIGNFTYTTGADVETKLDLVTAVDAPTALSSVETGSVIKGLTVDFYISGAYPVNSRFDFMVYHDKSNLHITSTTPCADFNAETLPVTEAMIKIRQAHLAHRRIITSNVQEPPIHLVFKLRKPIRMAEGDAITFVSRSSVTTTASGTVTARGVCYK